MSKRKTLEEWQNESDNKHNFEFNILEVPKSGLQVVDILHKKCGNILSIKLHGHLKTYCKYCSGKHNRSLEECQRDSDIIHNNEFTILKHPLNIKEKVDVLHKKCGLVSQMTMNNHINHKNGCKKCSKYSLKTNEYWIKKSKEIHGLDYEILESIKNVRHKVKIKHTKCGNVQLKDMNSFIHGGRGCEKCFRNYQKPIEYWQNKSNIKHSNQFIILEQPKNVNTKCLIRHNICKRDFFMSMRLHSNLGVNCPFCSASKGELLIMSYLIENNIEYVKEKTFIDLKLNGLLRFDYYLPIQNMCIEFDGIFHYEAFEFIGGIKALESSKIRDNIKNEYCIKNNINLLRISYIDIENIEKILKNKII